MRFTLFSLAAIIAVTSAERKLSSEKAEFRNRNLKARGNKRQARLAISRDQAANTDATDTERFVEWASLQGQSYQSTREFNSRRLEWSRTDAKIKATNAEADASGNPSAVRLKHNKFSAMTQAEKDKVLGLRLKEDQLKGGRKLDDDREQEHGRKLSVTAGAIDWAASGHTGPVKDQGGCGSCYTFASNTVLEATIAHQTGQPYQRLSEQQVVDCSNNAYDPYYYNYGCNGGFMTEAWWYQMDHGAMTNADYPYISGQTGSAGECQQQPDKYVARVDHWGSVETGVTDMIAKLEERVLTVAVAAGSDTWFYYDSGVVTSSECGTALDHAVTLVGYEPGETEAEVASTLEYTITECRKQRWKDMFYDSGCQYSDENLIDDRYCCWEYVYTEEEMSGGDAFWKIQNSWGSEWGDQGFIYLAVEGDIGVCGMNQWVEWVQPALD